MFWCGFETSLQANLVASSLMAVGKSVISNEAMYRLIRSPFA